MATLVAIGGRAVPALRDAAGERTPSPRREAGLTGFRPDRRRSLGSEKTDGCLGTHPAGSSDKPSGLGCIHRPLRSRRADRGPPVVVGS
jgi:hypothetical protein